MSKSKGNVIDPLSLIDEYSADALRFTLAAMAAQGRDIKLSIPRVEGYRNFATKLWNASRFAELNGCARVEGFDPRAVKDPLNRWMLAEAAAATLRSRRGDRGIPLQRRRQRRLSLHLERAVRLVPGARQAGVARRSVARRPRPRRARRSRMCSIYPMRCCTRSCRSSPRSFGRSRAPRARRARGRSRSAPWPDGGGVSATPRRTTRSAGWSNSSRRSARFARRWAIAQNAPLRLVARRAQREGRGLPAALAADARAPRPASKASTSSSEPPRELDPDPRSRLACRAAARRPRRFRARARAARQGDRQGRRRRSPRSTPSSPTPTSWRALPKRSSRKIASVAKRSSPRFAKLQAARERLEKSMKNFA